MSSVALVCGPEIQSNLLPPSLIANDVVSIENLAGLEVLLDQDQSDLVGLINPDQLGLLVADFFGTRSPPIAASPDPMSITRFGRYLGTTRLLTYNDTSQLEQRPASVSSALEAGDPVVALIRHGQTPGNVAGRWQGSTDEELNEVGEAQAAALAEWYGGIDTVWSSPLLRAAGTAAALNPEHRSHPGLVEFAFGAWEGLTTDEIRAVAGEDFDRIFVDGSDHPRGGTGETWSGAEERMRAALTEVDPKGGVVTGIVSHGAAIRALLTSFTEERWLGAFRVAIPPNTSVTHLILSADPVVADYGVAPHLGN